MEATRKGGTQANDRQENEQPICGTQEGSFKQWIAVKRRTGN